MNNLGISKCKTYRSEQWHYSQTDRIRHLPGRQVPANKDNELCFYPVNQTSKVHEHILG